MISVIYVRDRFGKCRAMRESITERGEHDRRVERAKSEHGTAYLGAMLKQVGEESANG